MAELTRELNVAPDAVPAFFRLGPVNNSKVKDVLHQIQKSGMEDPRSTHQLLSLFQPEEFSDDAFHVLSPNTKPKTLWDQVAEAASNPGKLTADQKGALTSLKYFALQSLAEDPQEHVMRGGQTRVLNESVREAAKTELRKYDAYLAKALDPEDFASARFFDTAKVVGKVAGRTTEAAGTAYLMLNLLGCSFGGGYIPTSEIPTTPANPAITQTVPGIEQPSATPDIGLVGVASPTPEIGVTATPEIGQPTVWQPPTAEQARAGVGGSFPEGYEQVVDAMRAIVLEQVPGAKEAGAAWNNGLGDNFHSIFWARAASGNYLWKTGEAQAFDEYPMYWNEYQSGLTLGQEFAEIPDSKSAVVGFTGPSAGGLGEKPVLMKTAVTLADGQTQEFLEYFDFQAGEWKLNPNILQAMVPDGYTVSQNESGKWLASADNQTMLQFDLDQKEWLAAMAPRPDFESLSDMEMAKLIWYYGKLLDSQLHFSPEELEALPFASAPPKLISKEIDGLGIGRLMYSAELVGLKEMPVVDEAGLPIGTIFVGLFGGTGDAPGDRKIFSALLGAELWGVVPRSSYGELDVGRRYNLRVFYGERIKYNSEAEALNRITKSISGEIRPGDINSMTVEDFIFIVICNLNITKINDMGQFFNGLPTDANIILYPEFIMPSQYQ